MLKSKRLERVFGMDIKDTILAFYLNLNLWNLQNTTPKIKIIIRKKGPNVSLLFFHQTKNSLCLHFTYEVFRVIEFFFY
jgi:hypothetical protein